MTPRQRRWLSLALWPLPNLKAWVAFLGGFFAGGMLVAVALAVGFVVLTCRP
ncbi:MAG: hypothetical protein L3K23_10440 [Thermoplasmata archaeon]|nr:hypothetical protein [Thermoplasmata archaeon]